MSQKGAKNVEKLKEYTSRPEVNDIYRSLNQSAKVINVTNFAVDVLGQAQTINALAKMAPTLAKALGKVGKLSKALGPAGAVLGMGMDLLVAFGVIKNDMMQKLDEISRQIEDLRDDVKMELKVTQALGRFLPIHDKMLANVQRFEQISASPGDAESFCERLGDMVKDYSPNEIIVDLRQIHNLITGEGGFGKPLFEQLAEEAYALEGDQFDQFIGPFLLRFQTVVGLEIRAIRMLRSFVSYEEEDAIYAEDIKAIFKDLALQRKEYDPAQMFDWYIKFMAFGGQATMTTERWPGWYAYMDSSALGNIRGWDGHPGDQGVFDIKPRDDGTFLMTTKEWPNWYVFMESSAFENVRGWEGDPGPQGHWKFAVIDARVRRFKLSPREYPGSYMHMEGNAWGNVSGTSDPGPEGHFDLHLV